MILPAAANPGSVPAKEERTWAMFIHLSALAGHLFPFAHIIAPLIIWQIRKDTSAFVDAHGREAVNAQITFTIYFAIAFVLCFVLIGIPIIAGLYLGNLILIILAAIAGNDGRMFRYPLILRLV